MSPQFICHKDFSCRVPRNVFHKEHAAEQCGNDEEKYCNKHILFRKKITLKEPTNAVLKITADDYFKLYINGRFVVQGPPPGYPQKYYYMELDVSEFITAGENVFAVHTYYQGLINRVWVSGDGRASFWCELSVDGKTVMVSDGSWLTREHSGYSSCGVTGYDTYFLECYDSNSREVGFERPSYNDAEWEHASLFSHADYTLEKSPLRPLVVARRAPVSQRKEGQYIRYDFGQEMVGNLCVTAQGKKGDKVLLRFGEELNADGSVRYELRCNCKYEEQWILSGGEDTLEQFDYKAFRYLEIVCPLGVQIYEVQMAVRHYPCEVKTEYAVTNERLRDILTLCENTVRYGVQEVFVDCPTREKGQYLGDLCISGRAHAVLTRDTTLLRKSLLDFCESSFVCKGLMAVSPSAYMQEIADYSLLFPSLVLWVYKQDGDISFLTKCAVYLLDMYEYFRKYCNGRGLLDGVDEKWNLVDWPDNCRDGYDFPLTNPVGSGIHNVLNAFWIDFLQSSEQICHILGQSVDYHVQEVKDSFIRSFYNEKTGLFCDSESKTHSAVQSNVLPLLFGIGTEDISRKRRLVDFIVQKGLGAASVYFAYFTLCALVKNGEREKAVALATADEAWYTMLREGATTTFEAWSKEQKWNTSLLHPWAVAPLIVFCSDVEPY